MSRRARGLVVTPLGKALLEHACRGRFTVLLNGLKCETCGEVLRGKRV